jgi:hypothetical protein
MATCRRYLAEIGRRGGLKSRRSLDPETARQMVRLREARRAFRRFHAVCFSALSVDRPVRQDDVDWIAERLIREGGEAEAVGLRLRPPVLTPRSDTTPEAEAVRIAAARRRAPADRLRQAMVWSESLRRVAVDRLRQRYPGRSDVELVELLLGVEWPHRDGHR